MTVLVTKASIRGSERCVPECRHRDRMDLAEVRRSGWPEMVTSAPAQEKRDQESGERSFHYSGVAVASGVADGAGFGKVSVVADGGAVVVSGRSEAGGGSDKSISGGGSGASVRISASEREPGAVSIFLLFLLAVAAVTAGSLKRSVTELGPQFGNSFLGAIALARVGLLADDIVIIDGGRPIMLLLVVKPCDLEGGAGLLTAPASSSSHAPAPISRYCG